MIEHFYQKIPGYFSFPDFYTWLAQEFPSGRGVEVGSFAGRSAAYLAVELSNWYTISRDASSRPPMRPRLDLVDTFSAAEHTPTTVRKSLSLVDDIIGNIHTCVSWEGAARYENGSLDYVYIDADHHYREVCRDIDAWLPKVRPGGIIAGHDYAPYEGFGVIEAVTERFSRIEVWRGEIFTGDSVRDFSHDKAWLDRYYPTWCVRL